MQITFAEFNKFAKRAIAEGLVGPVKVIALQLSDGKCMLEPNSCPYLDNTDRFNRPFHANDNLA